MRILPKYPFAPQRHRTSNTMPSLPPSGAVWFLSQRPEVSKLEAPVSRPVAGSMELEGTQLFLSSLYYPWGPFNSAREPFLAAPSVNVGSRYVSHRPGVFKLEAPAPRPSFTSPEPAPPLTPFLGGTALKRLPSTNGVQQQQLLLYTLSDSDGL